MLTRHGAYRLGLIGLSLLLTTLGTPTRAAADSDDPPGRVARLAVAEGSVSFQPGGTEDWVAAPLNRPLTTGDKLWSDRDSRVELQLDGSVLRLSSSTALAFLNLDDQVTQLQLTAGTLLVHVRRLDDNETYEIDTPNLAFSILRPGVYRLSVDESGTTTSIRVRDGQGEVTGGGFAYSVRANETDVFSGTDQLAEATQPNGGGEDPFDAWSASRDGRWDRSPSARYVSAEVVGYQDLDDQGSWRDTPENGYVWFPRQVPAGWAPYHEGHWAYIAPWGYTWVDDAPWGFAPFHYGRWVSVNGIWGWVPAPPHPEGVLHVRPVYAPALVAWVGVGAGIAWFALGPREVYVPSYPVSRGYVSNINVTNTTVNTTVINNVYNTNIINNRTVNVTNVTYVNRNVPGAVTATTPRAFTSAQAVSRNPVRMDPHAIAAAPVKAIAPAAIPTKQAVLGPARVAAAKPPAAVQTRVVVARQAPPPPPPAFERRQEEIRQNAGKGLSVAQTRQLQSRAPAASMGVHVAPPATPRVATPPSVETPRVTTPPSATAARVPPPVAPPARSEPNPSAASPRADRPPARPAPREVQGNTAAAIHPNELPVAPRPPSPNAANSVLERQHLQEQQQLHAMQEQQRAKIQQQQEVQHQQLAKERADVARQQQLEQQHQQQTQALQQQHLQAQQQLQERQQQQRRQIESQTTSPKRKEDRPPGAHP